MTSKAGATVEMSTVMGKGFPIVENFSGYKYDFPIQNVVLSATGTGWVPRISACLLDTCVMPVHNNGIEKKKNYRSSRWSFDLVVSSCGVYVRLLYALARGPVPRRVEPNGLRCVIPPSIEPLPFIRFMASC